jgi:anhydro-N-acetylmuramic acid kinase
VSLADIERLGSIARKADRRIVGLMSGTSLDGLDVAVCTVTGAGLKTKVTLDAFTTIPYSAEFKERVLASFARKTVELCELTVLNAVIGRQHAALIDQALRSFGIERSSIDLIASHGQTIYHAPHSLHGRDGEPNATLQLGDGDHIAYGLGIITVSDFRQKSVAAGGEGAPLAAYGDVLLFADEKEPRCLLNMGGIANLTYLPAGNSIEGRAFSSDIGPGNTLMDAFMRQHFGRPYDADGRVAALGQVIGALLERLLQDPFIALPFPKTTGPEHFSLEWFEAHRAAFSTKPKDAMATLNAFSARTIADGVRHAMPEGAVIASGGGIHNRLLMGNIKAALPGYRFTTTEAFGIDPDAKEAVLFALLANELIGGDPDFFRGRIAGAPAVTMGKISLPG